MAEIIHSSTVAPAFKLIRRLVLISLGVMLLLTALLSWPAFSGRFAASSAFMNTGEAKNPQNAAGFPLFNSSAAAIAVGSTPAAPASMPGSEPVPFAPLDNGLIVLSINPGGYSNLYAAQWQGMPITRLTGGDWNDIHPSLNPTNTWLAFASDRDGQWDLYQMDLSNGDTIRLTNTPQYDGSPSWSPDGRWLVYESYVDAENQGSLEIFIQPADGSQTPIQLTNDPATDHSPSWSPGGRQIAFVSTRSGENEIWLADLDQVEDRFQNLSQDENTAEDTPAWSPDGSRLVWSGRGEDGTQNLFVWDITQPANRPVILGSGAMAAWDPADQALLAVIETPNQTYLSAYNLVDRSLAFPSILLPGKVSGTSWGQAKLPENLPEAFQAAAQATPTPPWMASITDNGSLPGNRYRIVSLEGIEAASPVLQDAADEAFLALRQTTADLAGWDFLASLEQAYIPLSAPVGPATKEDWLYTGRAFRFNQAPVNAGWVLVSREDYGAQTYWRIFLRTRFQDGSQGQPLSAQPWNFSSRFSGDPRAYEEGGNQEIQVPSGYWLDFTNLALAYGWERQPALGAWRTAYSALRYHEFVLRQGLDWLSAMAQIYPRQALDTPTPVPPPTHTPTITITPTFTCTPTRTPYYTRTPRPTSTPWPTRTLRPTRTPYPTLPATPTPAN